MYLECKTGLDPADRWTNSRLTSHVSRLLECKQIMEFVIEDLYREQKLLVGLKAAGINKMWVGALLICTVSRHPYTVWWGMRAATVHDRWLSDLQLLTFLFLPPTLFALGLQNPLNSKYSGKLVEMGVGMSGRDMQGMVLWMLHIGDETPIPNRLWWLSNLKSSIHFHILPPPPRGKDSFVLAIFLSTSEPQPVELIY